MTDVTRRSVKEGIGFGLLAGIIFAVAEVIAAVAMGMPALEPFRMFASVLFGAGALEFGPGAALIAGAIIHLILAAIFGVIYGLINTRLPLEAHTNWGSQIVLGLVYGAALWLVTFQIIARIAYPWFLETNQLAQFLLHAIFFGLPLGLLYATGERRIAGAPARQPAPQPS